MTVLLIIAVWWLLLAFMAWGLCRTAHVSDERIKRMHGGWRNDHR